MIMQKDFEELHKDDIPEIMIEIDKVITEWTSEFDISEDNYNNCDITSGQTVWDYHEIKTMLKQLIKKKLEE